LIPEAKAAAQVYARAARLQTPAVARRMRPRRTAMFQVNQAIWNDLASSQPLRSRDWTRLMLMDDSTLTRTLDKIGKALEHKGMPTPVILAYLVVAPLLAENAAISRYIETKHNPSLRQALPELTTVEEAISLASMEYSLTAADQKKLRALLAQPTKLPSGVLN
jgi:hypothetical protein